MNTHSKADFDRAAGHRGRMLTPRRARPFYGSRINAITRRRIFDRDLEIMTVELELRRGLDAGDFNDGDFADPA